MRVSAPMIRIKPAVATISPSQMGKPLRALDDGSKAGRSNMTLASATPESPPRIWHAR